MVVDTTISGGLAAIGSWQGADSAPSFGSAGVTQAASHVRHALHVVRDGDAGRVGVAFGGTLAPGQHGRYPWLATLPAMYPEWLGDRSFNEVHGTRFSYVQGAMANGIATTRLVIAMARSGMLGFFGAAGLTRDRVEAALDELQGTLDAEGLSWGSNLIHSPAEPALEEGVADLYVQRGVRRVSASAYMKLTPAIVRYAATGLTLGADGSVQRTNFVFAKISRPETAKHFLMPAPKDMLDKLVAAGKLSASEGELALRVPVAEDYIVEADSGGHTDNQTLTALFPTIARLRDQITAEQGYTRPIRLGAAGGLGTPAAVAAAFGLGAAFVVTGSVNQATVESGLSEAGRKMLATAGLADVTMAPAADMFELGVEVQVLQRGTMFAPRAHMLYNLYRNYGGLDELPADIRARLEKQYFQQTLDQVWADTKAFFNQRDPREVAKAERDPKHQMALVFRSYLGRSSRWAIVGDPARVLDYQIWCGPAMGAFNAWTRGSFLEEPSARTAVQVARNLLEGAAVIARAQQLRSYGVPVPDAAFHFAPRPLG